MNKIYLIYRTKANGLICKYSIIRNPSAHLDEYISQFNKDDKNILKVELTDNEDFKTLIELVESAKILKADDVKSIQESLDNLQNEVYHLNDRLKEGEK